MSAIHLMKKGNIFFFNFCFVYYPVESGADTMGVQTMWVHMCVCVCIHELLPLRWQQLEQSVTWVVRIWCICRGCSVSWSRFSSGCRGRRATIMLSLLGCLCDESSLCVVKSQKPETSNFTIVKLHHKQDNPLIVSYLKFCLK